MCKTCYFILQGFVWFLSCVLQFGQPLLINCVICCNVHLCNHVQCVRLPKLGSVCCLLLCCCDTPPSAGCCFSINITLEAASLSHSRGSTPEGTQNQSAVEEGSIVRSVIITLERVQCMNRTPMNNCCCPLRSEACCSSD